MISVLGGIGVAPGDWIGCNPQALAGLLGTYDDFSNPGGSAIGVNYVVDRLKAKKLIEQETLMAADDGTMRYRLTFDGWERFDEIHRHVTNSRIAFMAMDFKCPELDVAFKAF